MRRSLAALGLAPLAVVGAVVLVSTVSAGCATSEPALLDPTGDPSLPGVDASTNPTPLPGDSGSGTKPKDASTADDAEVEEETDSSSPVKPDAAPVVDSGPTTPKPTAGEVLITEVMYNTLKGTEPGAEWIEVYNRASSARSLTGLTLRDGGARTHVITGTVTIAAGAYGVLVRSRTAATGTALVPSGVILYEYGASLPDNAGIQLANGATGSITLANGATTVATANYGSWFSQSGGSSVQLKVLDPSQTGLAASWCLSLSTWAAGSDKGTPGAAEDCP